MQDTLITSALFEITLAVLLGWPLTMFLLGRDRVGPIHSAKRLLQAHLDYVFMALLQFAIAAVHPAIPTAAGVLLIIGSWMNPTLFIIAGSLPEGALQKPALMALTFGSFLTLTVAYPWLLVAWLMR